jgi:hypothetical protein
MFPSPSILQHYVEFNTCTIPTLEKLSSLGSFDGFIGHLVRRQAILFAFLNWTNLLFVVQIVATTFLGCWALIVPTLVIHF